MLKVADAERSAPLTPRSCGSLAPQSASSREQHDTPCLSTSWDFTPCWLNSYTENFVQLVSLRPAGERETDRQTETERETDRERETERQREREGETERDRETDRQTDRDCFLA